MPDVFVNYRTGDGDEAANILEGYLTDRFGEGRIFRAVRSIQPGKPYDKSLLAGVWGCSVLLAIIGPTWTDHPGLKADDDWVRREILEARAANVPVIPVLKGRKAARVRAADLPPELEWLAMVQSMLLDTRDSDADLRRIGDRLAEVVPSLREADHANRRAPETGPARNDARDVEGPVAQVGSVAGSFTSSPVSNSHGVNIGPGPQTNYWYSSAPERKGASPRKQWADDLRELDRCFVHPAGFEAAAAKLHDHRTVYLKGARGSGRTTAAKILLKRVRPDVETIHELVVQGKEDEAESPLDPELIDNGGLIWADLRETGGWSWDEIRHWLPGVRHTMLERSAYLVAVLPDEAKDYEDEISSYFAEIRQPPLAEVLLSHLGAARIPLGEVSGIAFVADQRPLREVPEYVSHIKAVKAEAPEAGLGTWCETAYKRLSGRDEEVRELVRKQDKGPQRALMLAAAMLPNAHADLIEEGARRLLELTGQPECDLPPLERRPLDNRLCEITAERDPSGHIAFRETGRDAVIRSYFWAHMAELRETVREWVTATVQLENLLVTEQDALVGNLVDLCLADRYQHFLLKVVADWTHSGTSGREWDAAALTLHRGLRSDQASRMFRRQIYTWARDESISIPRARLLIAACRDDMAVRYPDAALIRLLHLARRRPGLGAEEAVTEMAREDRYLLRLALDRLAGSRHSTARSSESRIFLGLADPKLFTVPGPGGRQLIAEVGVREQLIRVWGTVFAIVEEGRWEARAGDWLEAACADRDGADGLLDVLATAAAAQIAVAARLWAMTRRSGFDPAVSQALRQKTTAAQLAKTSDPSTREEPGGTL